jgi:hypothetical protein
MPDEADAENDPTLQQFLNLSTLMWEDSLPKELQAEYDRLFDAWVAARRACYGVYGAVHYGARLAESAAWDKLSWYCNQHRYLPPSVGVLRDQVDAQDAATSVSDIPVDR